jgi:hypothetical protein
MGDLGYSGSVRKQNDPLHLLLLTVFRLSLLHMTPACSLRAYRVILNIHFLRMIFLNLTSNTCLNTQTHCWCGSQTTFWHHISL